MTETYVTGHSQILSEWEIWLPIRTTANKMVNHRYGWPPEWLTTGMVGHTEWLATGMVGHRNGWPPEWLATGMVCHRNGQPSGLLSTEIAIARRMTYDFAGSIRLLMMACINSVLLIRLPIDYRLLITWSGVNRRHPNIGIVLCCSEISIFRRL